MQLSIMSVYVVYHGSALHAPAATGLFVSFCYTTGFLKHDFKKITQARKERTKEEKKFSLLNCILTIVG